MVKRQSNTFHRIRPQRRLIIGSMLQVSEEGDGEQDDGQEKMNNITWGRLSRDF